MKYLKTYKLFEANWYDIKDHIKVLSDMSLSLWDKDFNVQVSDQTISKSDFNDPTPEHECIVVNIVKRGDKKFTYTEIKDELVDMIDFMDREGWKILEVEYLDPSFGRHFLKHLGELTPDNLFSSRIDSTLNQLIVKFVEKGEVKTNESTEEDVHREMMIKKYGLEQVEECDEVIRNISDMALEVEDLGITVLVEYSPMTYLSFNSTPKMSVSVIADEKLFAGKIADIDIFTDTLLGYVKSLGFSTGKNTFTSDDRKLCRQILIQK